MRPDARSLILDAATEGIRASRAALRRIAVVMSVWDLCAGMVDTACGRAVDETTLTATPLVVAILKRWSGEVGGSSLFAVLCESPPS